MTQTITIGAAANERYFPGLIAMVVSMLLHTDKNLTIDIHIIDGGILDESWNLLERKTKQINSNVRVIRHVIDLKNFDQFPKHFGGDVMTYARLFFPELIAEDAMIYLDSDILFCKDIRTLWEVDIEDLVLAVCNDPLMEAIGQDCSNCLDYGVDPKGAYFNAGILKINLKEWRQQNITEKAFQYITTHVGEYKFHDQSALNIVTFNKVKFIDTSFNCFSDNYLIVDKKKQTYNIHFLMAQKPWLYYHTGLSYQLFYELIEALHIPLRDEKYLQSLKANQLKNKYLNFFLCYWKIKRTFLKLKGNKKEETRLKNTLKYWQIRVELHKNKNIRRQNTLVLENWKASMKTIL